MGKEYLISSNIVKEISKSKKLTSHFASIASSKNSVDFERNVFGANSVWKHLY